MKQPFGMFVLTPGEQRLVIFAVLALALGSWVKQYHEMKPKPSEPGTESWPAPLVSPSPSEP